MFALRPFDRQSISQSVRQTAKNLDSLIAKELLKLGE